MDHKYHYPKYCLFIFIAVFIWAAINPIHRMDWLIESLLSVIFVIILYLTHKKFRLSNLSYTLITVFLVLHTVGSHYTYSNVPFLNWLWEMTNATRNHYDRIVHFSFGLLLAYPIREVFIRITGVKGFWGYYLPFDVAASLSAIYEIVEYGAVLVVNPQLGDAYLGTQGDIWDAQKDMALAITGSLVTMIVTAIVNWHYNKRFGKEIADSFTVKEPVPLGEVKIAEYKKQ